MLNYFLRYERVEVNRIVHNKARKYYFHPYYCYYYIKYITYKLHYFFYKKNNYDSYLLTRPCIKKKMKNKVYKPNYRVVTPKKKSNLQINYSKKKRIPINNTDMLKFSKVSRNWLLNIKRIKKIKLYPIWRRRKIPKKLTKLLKRRLLTNYINKMELCSNYSQLTYTFLLFILYKNKSYLTLANQHQSLKWLKQKYHKSFMEKISIRKHIISSYFKFKLSLTQNLCDLWLQSNKYSNFYKVSIFRLEIKSFQKIYYQLAYVYYYIKGYNQLSKNKTLNYYKTPYLIFWL